MRRARREEEEEEKRRERKRKAEPSSVDEEKTELGEKREQSNYNDKRSARNCVLKERHQIRRRCVEDKSMVSLT